MFRLPVSSQQVRFRTLTGELDLVLLEGQSVDPWLALDYLQQVVRPVGESEIAWLDLSISDFEVLLLGLRQAVVGDVMRNDVQCTAGGCGARMDIHFRISEYVAYHAPRRPRGVEALDETGWYRLRDASVEFRLPTVADLLAVVGLPDAGLQMAARCLRPPALPAKVRSRVERALEAMAPPLSGELEGVCRECRARLPVYFDVLEYVLRELRQRAVSLFEDVHILASRYHWGEDMILRMPTFRRQMYVELASAMLGAGTA